MEHKHLVFLLLIAGLLLRIYSSVYTPIIPFDEMLYMLVAIGTVSSPWQRLSTLYHGPIYFYLTDLSFSLFGGMTYFASRFFPIIFSTASIALVYLLSKELYGKRTALLSSAIFALLSTTVIYGSRGLFEPIYTALLLLSFLFFVRRLKYNDNKELLYSASFFAVAATTKIVVFYFLPAFAVYYFLSVKKVQATEFAKPVLVFLLLFSPIILYNYFLYSDKGLADFHVTRIFNIESSRQTFLSFNFAGIADPWFRQAYSTLPLAFYNIFINITPLALLLMVAGLLSVLSFQNKREDGFLLAWLTIPVILYAAYVFHDYYIAVLSPPIAILIAKGVEALASLAGKAKAHPVLLGILVIFALFELYSFSNVSVGKSANYQLREFALTIPNNAIILTDPLIYDIYAYASFANVHGAPSSRFIDLIYDVHNLGFVDDVHSDMYYVKCELDNCGWDDKSLSGARNQSRDYGAAILPQSAKIKEIYEGKILVYGIYRTTTALPRAAMESLENYDLFGSQVGKPELSIDVYRLHGPLYEILNIIGHAALYFDIFLALLCIPLTIKLLADEKENE